MLGWLVWVIVIFGRLVAWLVGWLVGWLGHTDIWLVGWLFGQNPVTS